MTFNSKVVTLIINTIYFNRSNNSRTTPMHNSKQKLAHTSYVTLCKLYGTPYFQHNFQFLWLFLVRSIVKFYNFDVSQSNKINFTYQISETSFKIIHKIKKIFTILKGKHIIANFKDKRPNLLNDKWLKRILTEI